MTKQTNDTNPDNDTVLNVAQIIKAVMSSAAEAKLGLGALYINAKLAVLFPNHFIIMISNAEWVQHSMIKSSFSGNGFMGAMSHWIWC